MSALMLLFGWPILSSGTKLFCVPSMLSGTLLVRLTDSIPGMTRRGVEHAHRVRRRSEPAV